MKALLLAGGTGSRLYPVTYTEPKQLLPVANKPVLEYAIEDCADSGISEIGIILGSSSQRRVKNRIGDGTQWGVDITYILQHEPLGIAHAISRGRDYIGEDPFVVYLGDVMVEAGISGLIDSFDQASEVARIGVQEVAEPSRYGIVEVGGDGNIQNITEKPDKPNSNLAAVGICVFSPLIFPEIDKLSPSWRGELELSDAIQRLIQRGDAVQKYVFKGWWKDVGTPSDAIDANRLVLQGVPPDERGIIHIGEGSVIEEGATIKGPVSIGERSVIGGDANIGPYVSVGSDCEISKATVRSSIVKNDCNIMTSEDISDSVIGSGVTIRDRSGRGVSIVVADNTQLDL